MNRAPTEMEYLMRNVKLDAPEKHDLYVKAMKANKFDSIALPEGLPPINHKPQVYTFRSSYIEMKLSKKVNYRDRLETQWMLENRDIARSVLHFVLKLSMII